MKRQPFVSSPFPYPADLVDHYRSEMVVVSTATQSAPHPLSLALEWKRVLDQDPTLNMTKLARTNGISRARVSQVMNLLALPESIQTSLLSIPTPQESRFLSEHRLRKVMALSTTSERIRYFCALRVQFAGRCVFASS